MKVGRKTVSLRRPPGLALALVAVAAILVPMARGPAGAAPSADPNPTPDDTWGTNGLVYAILPVGNTIYVGGKFTEVGPDGTGTPRVNLAAFDATTGEATAWNPVTNKSVYALEVSDDGSTIYAGGSFTRVGGLVRNKMAAIDAVTGAVLPGFMAHTDGPVWELLLRGTRLYVGGDFTTISLEAQYLLAAVDPATGSLDSSWRPVLEGPSEGKPRVRALALSVDSSLLYFGGTFIGVNGETRLEAAAVDAETAELDPWDPGLNYKVMDLVVTEKRVFVGGAPGPLPGGEMPAIDPVTGVVYWRRQGNGDMNAVGVLGPRVYVGGHFMFLQGDITRARIAAVKKTTGALDPWDPGANGEVWSIAVVDNHIYVGGGFTVIGGVLQPGFARFTDPGV
jgi:hypothetical protein